MLAWTIYLSFAGALLEALLPKGKPRWRAGWRWPWLWPGWRWRAGFVAGMGQGRELIVDLPWVPSMGIHFLLAADGISRVLVLLTGWPRWPAFCSVGTSSCGRMSFSRSFWR
jgi:NADH-quinone oxidoreductase subunit M